jgi:DNA-binding Lrp family transcriptional regulator
MICSLTATAEEIMPLDSVDRRMLEILQREGRISNAALAERLHLSPSPCLRRLRVLEREGLISGYRAVLDRTRLGLGLTVSSSSRSTGTPTASPPRSARR